MNHRYIYVDSNNEIKDKTKHKRHKLYRVDYEKWVAELKVQAVEDEAVFKILDDLLK